LCFGAKLVGHAGPIDLHAQHFEDAADGVERIARRETHRDQSECPATPASRDVAEAGRRRRALIEERRPARLELIRAGGAEAEQIAGAGGERAAARRFANDRPVFDEHQVMTRHAVAVPRSAVQPPTPRQIHARAGEVAVERPGS
jgi:hypothetical protein